MEVLNAICFAAGWLIPFHLQLLFSQVRTLAPRGPIDVELVATAVERIVGTKTYFSHWEERLAATFGKVVAPVANDVLDAAANDSDGATRSVLLLIVAKHGPDADTQLRWILDVLCNDGYLVHDEGRYRFRSGLLRRYWTRSDA